MPSIISKPVPTEWNSNRAVDYKTKSEKLGLAFLFSDVAESFLSSHIHSLVFLCVNQRLKDDKSKKDKTNI